MVFDDLSRHAEVWWVGPSISERVSGKHASKHMWQERGVCVRRALCGKDGCAPRPPNFSLPLPHSNEHARTHSMMHSMIDQAYSELAKFMSKPEVEKGLALHGPLLERFAQARPSPILSLRCPLFVNLSTCLWALGARAEGACVSVC